MGFLAGFFKGTFRALFLGYIEQAHTEAVERVVSDSDKPAIKAVKEQAVTDAFNVLRAIVREKMD